MESMLKAVLIYVVLLVLLRVAGPRTLAQMTPFDLVLLLIISEAVQGAMLEEDHSLINAFILVCTLVLFDIVLSLVKEHVPLVAKIIDGVPMVVVDHGHPLHGRMKRARIDENDVMAAARQIHGLEQMEQIKFAILENDGSISIIPHEKGRPKPKRREAST